MGGILKIILGAVTIFGKILSWAEERRRNKNLKKQIEAEEDAQILKGVKRAKDITSKPLDDELLISPDQRGHNHD